MATLTTTYIVTAALTGAEIHSVSAHLHCATEAQAQRLAAMFPKFIKVRGGGISGLADDAPQFATKRDGFAAWGLVTFRADFTADGVNKGKNEAGLKRLRAFLQVVAWEYDAKAFGNSASREQFDALVAK